MVSYCDSQTLMIFRPSTTIFEQSSSYTISIMRGTVPTISSVRSSVTVQSLAVKSLRPAVVSAEFMTSVMNLVHQNIYYLFLERFGPEAETWAAMPQLQNPLS
jgi:hypothetical protein